VEAAAAEGAPLVAEAASREKAPPMQEVGTIRRRTGQATPPWRDKDGVKEAFASLGPTPLPQRRSLSHHGWR
jgi:hypothetical protein